MLAFGTDKLPFKPPSTVVPMAVSLEQRLYKPLRHISHFIHGILGLITIGCPLFLSIPTNSWPKKRTLLSPRIFCLSDSQIPTCATSIFSAECEPLYLTILFSIGGCVIVLYYLFLVHLKNIHIVTTRKSSKSNLIL